MLFGCVALAGAPVRLMLLPRFSGTEPHDWTSADLNYKLYLSLTHKQLEPVDEEIGHSLFFHSAPSRSRTSEFAAFFKTVL